MNGKTRQERANDFFLDDRSNICLRALNEVLSGDYELRVFRATLGDDTHIMFVQRASWWEDFDRQYPGRSGTIFRRIDEAVDFS